MTNKTFWVIYHYQDGPLAIVTDMQKAQELCRDSQLQYRGPIGLDSMELVQDYVSEPETESQVSKHCDAGYMNDMRFGDGPDY